MSYLLSVSESSVTCHVQYSRGAKYSTLQDCALRKAFHILALSASVAALAVVKIEPPRVSSILTSTAHSGLAASIPIYN